MIMWSVGSLAERQHLAKRVVHFYENIANRQTHPTVQHFVGEGYKQRALYYIIKRYLKKGSASFELKSGRRVTVSTPEIIRKVKRYLNHKRTSLSFVAKKVGVSVNTVFRIKKRIGLKTKKCRNVPKYTTGQARRAKTNCRKVYRLSIGKVLILDDETYVKRDPKAKYGQQYYHTNDDRNVPNSVKFTPQEKFGSKFLVWQAIDELGNVSEPYVKVGTMRAEEYLSECLIKRLVPFIHKHHSDEQVLFWPDLAAIHYANSVKEWLNANNIDFVSRGENPPAVPQARPIERFWNLCKQQYFKTTNEPKTVKQFENIWRKISRNVEQNSTQQITKGLRRTLKLIGNKGVLAPFK